jgi:7-cyano-7-deazaguanine synthase
MESPAVVLLSGGLDSATAAALARREGFALHCLSLSYGQRHGVELDAARRVAAALGAVRHLVLTVDLAAIGGSSLTDMTMEIPRNRPLEATDEIPTTYVPARNLVFISLAASWAEAIGARDIFLGVNALDYSGYPDCRPAFIQALERAINLGTKLGARHPETPWFRLRAPLIDLTKAEIIRLGTSLGLDYSLTRSCYDPHPDGRPCGVCDSCRLRAAGLAAAGLPDPQFGDYRP